MGTRYKDERTQSCRGREAVLEGGGKKRMWKICTLFWAERKVGGKTGVMQGELERERTRRKLQKSPWSGKVTRYSVATPLGQVTEKKHYEAKAAIFSERSIAQWKWRGRHSNKIRLVFNSHIRCESETYDDLIVAQESELSDKRSLSLVNCLTKTTTPAWKINGLKFNWNESARSTRLIIPPLRSEPRDGWFVWLESYWCTTNSITSQESKITAWSHRAAMAGFLFTASKTVGGRKRPERLQEFIVSQLL